MTPLRIFIVLFATGCFSFLNAEIHHDFQSKRQQAIAEINEAFEAGKLSEEEAKEKVHYVEKQFREHLFAKVKKGLGAAVELGEIDEEEAEELLSEMVERVQQENRERHHEQLREAMIEGIEAAIDLGGISEEKGDAWLAEIEDREVAEASDEDQERAEHLANIARGIESAVALGHLTEKDAEEMWHDISSGHD
ncbi:MAG: hypothetical protein AAF236_09330 [Verrucomicrobiota bacterium]